MLKPTYLCRILAVRSTRSAVINNAETVIVRPIFIYFMGKCKIMIVVIISGC